MATRGVELDFILIFLYARTASFEALHEPPQAGVHPITFYVTSLTGPYRGSGRVIWGGLVVTGACARVGGDYLVDYELQNLNYLEALCGFAPLKSQVVGTIVG